MIGLRTYNILVSYIDGAEKRHIFPVFSLLPAAESTTPLELTARCTLHAVKAHQASPMEHECCLDSLLSGCLSEVEDCLRCCIVPGTWHCCCIREESVLVLIRMVLAHHAPCTSRTLLCVAAQTAATARQNRAAFPVDPLCMPHVASYLSEIRKRDASRVPLSVQDRHSTSAS